MSGVLSSLRQEEQRALFAAARRRRFAAGEVVFHAGDPADTAHLILRGRVAVRVVGPRGDELTFAVLGPGELVGEMALLGPAPVPRSATASAVGPAETLAIRVDQFEALRRMHPGIDDLLLQLFAERVRLLNARLFDALYASAELRVLRSLSDLAALFGDDADTAVVPLTQEQIAALAGTSRAGVNRVLRELQAAGTVALARSRVWILDRSELARRARRA